MQDVASVFQSKLKIMSSYPSDFTNNINIWFRSHKTHKEVLLHSLVLLSRNVLQKHLMHNRNQHSMHSMKRPAPSEYEDNLQNCEASRNRETLFLLNNASCRHYTRFIVSVEVSLAHYTPMYCSLHFFLWHHIKAMWQYVSQCFYDGRFWSDNMNFLIF